MSDAARERLSELQRWFNRVVTHPESVAAGIQAAQELQPMAAPTLPSARLTAEARLGIYHDAYRTRLIACLADDFPALQHLLGEAAFRQLCLDYIAQFPSRSPSLNRFGAQMPAFCAESALPNAACASELALLEWAIVEVIHAADGSALSADALGALTPGSFGQAVFAGSPALRLLDQSFAVNAYYTTFRTDGTVATPPEPRRNFVVVRRRAATVAREELERPSAELLRALLAGKPVSLALEHAAESGMTAERVSAAFEQFLSHGFFVALQA